MLADHLSKYPNLKIQDFSGGEYFLRALITGSIDEPDVVLLDYFLDVSPGAAKDGLEILRKLKEISPEIKVIMVTSVDNPKIVDLAKKQGALDYVVKNAAGFNNLDAVLEKHSIVKRAQSV
jgi:DNA-binding NarL/FixJ family response regulator